MRFGRLPTFNSPLDALQQFQTEMNRLFDHWNAEPNGARGFATSFPAVNVWEEADAIHLEAELPGLVQEQIEIYVTGGNQVTIKGQRNAEAPEKGVWHRQERGQGSFVRHLTLPSPVDPDKVEARFENGVLTVKLAKHEAAKPRKIVVKS